MQLLVFSLTRYTIRLLSDKCYFVSQNVLGELLIVWIQQADPGNREREQKYGSKVWDNSVDNSPGAFQARK